MRSFSIQTLHYIAEAAMGGSSAEDSETSILTKITPKQRPYSRKGSPLIDPSVMGSGKMSEFGQTAAETVLKGPYSAIGLLGNLTGLDGPSIAASTLTAKLAPTMAKRFKKETEAQQEAVRGMSNVSNFYKNLNISTIPLHEPGELGWASKLLKMYTTARDVGPDGIAKGLLS